MKAEEISKGSLVIIKHSKEGGEVIEANRSDGRFLIKVARMKVNATGVKTQIVNILVDADDLEPIKKQKGIVIIQKDNSGIMIRKNTKRGGMKFVDLGLPSGTLWADRNIGADTPEQAGDYFRFGETTPFTEDSPEYCYENIDESIAGTTKDAATVILGKNYKIPTPEKISELFGVCKWEWTAMNGVNGMKVTGPNGNHIFFPASGCRYFDNGVLGSVGNDGYYWTASVFNNNWPDADDNRYAYCLSIYLGRYSSKWHWYGENRAYGYPVRAVLSSPKSLQRTIKVYI